MTTHLARRGLWLTIYFLVAAGGGARAQTMPAENRAPRRDALVAPAHASFRFTLNGFRVNQETNDDVLERDGAGDEVMNAFAAFVVDRTGAVVTAGRAISGVIATGMRTGGGYPNAAPAHRATTAAPGACPGQIPCVYYERELTAGQDAVVILPTLLEWDDGNDNELATAFVNDFRDSMRAIAGAVAPVINGAADGRFRRSDLGDNGRFSVIRPGPFGIGPKSRPIGMVRSGDGLVYRPDILVFTFAAADEASRTDYGFGAGIIPVTYVEDSSLRGSYTLYIQVEKLN